MMWSYQLKRLPKQRKIASLKILSIKRLLSWQWLLVVLLSFALTLLLHANQYKQQNSPEMINKAPLSTKGSQIIDANGREILLRGVNWFGLETELHAPHGLWARDYKEMLAQIKSQGYNIIRLPYSVQALRSEDVSGIDFTVGSNKDLEGKTPLEIMDAVIQEANRQGLTILLDSHRLNDHRIPELWYGDGFTEEDWLDTWKMLATRYKNQPNVIGADLKNEPHGRASWGTNDPKTDWRLAAERAGNAILSINPNWLIVVEGVENNVPGQQLKIHWMGGNLEGVKNFPVRLAKPNKLVYSPHEYGLGTFNQPWFFEPNFPQNLYMRWEIGFNYIATEKIAPIFIGEFGGRQVDNLSKEGIWQRQLVDYIDQHNLSFSYWTWNPNSADTGGILQDDWRTINASKQQLLNKLLPNSKIAGTNPPRIVNTPQSVPPNSSHSQLIPSSNNNSNFKTEVKLQSDWKEGFCINFQITNLAQTSISDWQLKFQMNQAAIKQSWNGKFVSQGSQYLVTPLDWGRTIQPNQSINLGFCANKLGADYQPQQISVSSTNKY